MRVGLVSDHLRVITASDVSDLTLKECLLAEGLAEIRCETVEPTLEDVFLALATEK